MDGNRAKPDSLEAAADRLIRTNGGFGIEQGIFREVDMLLRHAAHEVSIEDVWEEYIGIFDPLHWAVVEVLRLEQLADYSEQAELTDREASIIGRRWQCWTYRAIKADLGWSLGTIEADMISATAKLRRVLPADPWWEWWLVYWAEVNR